MKDYSIVIPVYFNEGCLSKTFDLIYRDVIQKNSDLDWEIIFVDDGSKDRSYEELLKIKKNNPDSVKVIKFTRNFGQVPAIIAGYRHATGKCIITLSADLQDPPDLINTMLNSYFSEKNEIVICNRIDRDESFFRRSTSKLFYHLMKKLCFGNMPTGGFDYLLISRKVADIITRTNESNIFLQGQILYTGYSIKFIPYKRLKREIGKSRWTFGKKMKYLLDGLLGYSYFPLRLMSFAGILISGIGFAYACIIFYNRIAGNVPFEGWAPLMILILLLSGIQMLMLGVIGEYLWRALDQVRKRPQYIIENIL